MGRGCVDWSSGCRSWEFDGLRGLILLSIRGMAGYEMRGNQASDELDIVQDCKLLC
jgi:hypothetical protein